MLEKISCDEIPKVMESVLNLFDFQYFMTYYPSGQKYLPMFFCGGMEYLGPIILDRVREKFDDVITDKSILDENERLWEKIAYEEEYLEENSGSIGEDIDDMAGLECACHELIKIYCDNLKISENQISFGKSRWVFSSNSVVEKFLKWAKKYKNYTFDHYINWVPTLGSAKLRINGQIVNAQINYNRGIEFSCEEKMGTLDKSNCQYNPNKIMEILKNSLKKKIVCKYNNCMKCEVEKLEFLIYDRKNEIKKFTKNLDDILIIYLGDEIKYFCLCDYCLGRDKYRNPMKFFDEMKDYQK